MPELDFANSVTLSTSAYTTTKMGAVLGSLTGGSNAATLYASDKTVAVSRGDSRETICINFIPSGTSLRYTSSGSALIFVPYK